MSKAQDVEDVDPEEFVTAAKKQVEDEDRAAKERKLVQVSATVDVEYQDNLAVGGGLFGSEGSGTPPRTVQLLRNNKVPDSLIASMTPNEAGELSRKIIARHKAGLCTFGQATVLRRAGYSKAEVETMRKDTAKACIDMCKSNGWRRPKNDNLVLEALELGSV
jgi:hypothetical protein